MNGRQLAQIALGVLGVSALVNAINPLMAVFMVVSSNEPRSSLLVVGVPAFLLLALSYILVFHSSTLVAAIAPAAGTELMSAASDIPRVLVALMGVMMALQALPSGVNTVFNILAVAGDPQSVEKGALVPRLIGLAADFGCALYLVIRPERFIAFLNRQRTEPVEVTA